MKHPLVLILASLSIIGPLYAQSHDMQIPGMKGTLATVQLWTENDGLPNHIIWGVFEDNRGIVWLQSGRNLCYFDGDRIVPVEQEDTQLYERHRTLLAEDKHHNIWRHIAPTQWKASPAKHKIDIYNPAEDRFYSLTEYLDGPAPDFSDKLQLYSIHQTVYIHDQEKEQLWYYNGSLQKVRFSANPQVETPETRRMLLPGPEGYYWEIDTAMQVQLLDSTGAWVRDYPPLLKDVKDGLYFLDQNGQLWYNHQQHVQALDLPGSLETRKPTRAYPILPRIQIRKNSSSIIGMTSVASTPVTLFLDTTQNIKYSVRGAAVNQDSTVIRVNEAIPDYDIKLISREWLPYILRNGNLLMPVPQGFLHIQQERRYFTDYLPGREIRGMAHLDSNTLAVVTSDNGALHELNLATGNSRQTAYDKDLHSYTVFKARDDIWLGMANGTLKRFNQRWQLRASYAPPQPIPYQEVKSLQYVTDSTLWYATYTGIIELNLNTDTTHYQWEKKYTHHIHRDRNGQYWIGTNNGLYHLASDRYYLHNLDQQTIPISHIYEDSHGVFWISTQVGFIRWKPFADTHERYTTADGLSHNIIHAAYPDQRGRLWLSSNRGIMAFDTASRSVMTYLQKNGLAGNEQNLASHLQDENGRIFFGGQKGITAFNPNSIPKVADLIQNNLHVNRIELYDRSGLPCDTLALVNLSGKQINLPQKIQQLKLQFFFLNFSLTKFNVEWKFGANSDWQQVNDNNTIFLTSLPPGRSELTLRVRYADLGGRENYYKITFDKAYPFYYSSWFWLAVLLANIGLFWLWSRYRTQKAKQLNRTLNQKVQERTRELAAENAKLEKLDTAKTQLFRNISHELRTPLSLISVAAEQQINHSGLSSELKLIKQEVQHMDNMITQILELSKLKMSVSKPEQQPAEWNTLIRRIFGLFQGLAQQKSIEYLLKLEPQADRYVQIDIRKLEHILSNLITNAIKFTPTGGHVQVQSLIEADRITLLVVDSGIGIPREEQEAIFSRGYQGTLPVEAEKDRPGFGIGLALCKEYVKLLGGEISVHSSPGEGSSFRVRLPYVPAQASESNKVTAGKTLTDARADPPTIATLLKKDVPRPRLLVVEDNAQMRNHLQQLLSNEYEVDTAGNGKEAFDLLSAQPEHYEVVISDIMMPYLDGFSLLQKTRAHPVLGYIPFLFLTALDSEQDKLNALRLGVDSFLTKPFSMIELRAQVANLTASQKKRRAFVQQKAKAILQSPQETIIEQEDEISYDDHWRQQLQGIIEQHYHRTDFKIVDIAHLMHVSERTLRNQIKQSTGLTPSAYLQKKRLQKAREFIKNKRYRTVSEVAYAVGFKDVRYFSKLFKKEFGKSPSDYL